MKTIYKLPAILIAAVMLQSCASNENKDSSNDTSSLDSIRDSTITSSHGDHAHDIAANDETTFLNAAAIGGLMEVEAASAAATKSNDAAVKEFATMMLKDHGKANKEVAMLATKLAIAIPTSLPEEHAKHLRELQKLNDKKFDQQYITMMLNDHAKTIKLFTAGQNVLNADVKAFATKTLPVIQAHYDKAVSIAKTLNLTNVGNGDDLQGVSPAAGETN